MLHTVSITSQGQISIPAKIREQLGFKKAGKALVEIREGKMVVEPVKDFLELGGSLKTNKSPLTSGNIHDMFAEHLATKAVVKSK